MDAMQWLVGAFAALGVIETVGLVVFWFVMRDDHSYDVDTTAPRVRTFLETGEYKRPLQQIDDEIRAHLAREFPNRNPAQLI